MLRLLGELGVMVQMAVLVDGQSPLGVVSQDEDSA